ncbi:MAG: 2-iminobutanoate/2-iminopropanoate deaminase [Paraburkholderia sp.]|nr:2-iminobutanoate/2-iminopropanoate deaminase [Paraburkholderia sp.]
MSSQTKFWMVEDAPTPVAPFSHATERDGWVFLTGQMPTTPGDDNAALPEGIAAQTTRVMDNLILVLEGMGLGLSDVVCARVFLTDFKRDYQTMNTTYMSYFEPGKLPARTCIGVTGLACDALVEIDFIARRGA